MTTTVAEIQSSDQQIAALMGDELRPSVLAYYEGVESTDPSENVAVRLFEKAVTDGDLEALIALKNSSGSSMDALPVLVLAPEFRTRGEEQYARYFTRDRIAAQRRVSLQVERITKLTHPDGIDEETWDAIADLYVLTMSSSEEDRDIILDEIMNSVSIDVEAIKETVETAKRIIY